MTGDPKRLLGGYATDTLTEDERRELLRAAMADQKPDERLLEIAAIENVQGMMNPVAFRPDKMSM